MPEAHKIEATMSYLETHESPSKVLASTKGAHNIISGFVQFLRSALITYRIQIS